MHAIVTAIAALSLGGVVVPGPRIGAGVRAGPRSSPAVAETLPLFRAIGGMTNGVAQLDPDLTINSTTVTPCARYKLGDADATDLTAWTYGETMTLSAAGSMEFNTGSPLFGTFDDSAKFDGTNHYSGSTSLCDIAAEDFVFEFLVEMGTGGSKRVLAKATSTGAGYYVQVGNGDRFVLTVTDGTNSAYPTSALTMVPGAWYHVLIFGNRDEASTNGSQVYVNGIASGSGVDISAVTTLTNSQAFKIGAWTPGHAYDGKISYAAAWKQSSWHQAGAAGPTEWAAIAAERFSRLAGTYASLAGASAVPTVQTRASVASLRKRVSGVTTLWTVGNDWPVIESFRWNGANITAYYTDQTFYNDALNSEAFDLWTASNVTVTADDAAAPDGETTADAIKASDTSDVLHYVHQNTGTSGFLGSTYAKAGAVNWLRVSVGTNPSSAGAYFNLAGAEGTVGTVYGTDAKAWIEPMGNGWYRCIVLTPVNAWANVYIGPASADDTLTYAAADTTSAQVHLWGAHVTRNDRVHNYIATAGSAATSSPSTLQYSGAAGNVSIGQGTVQVSYLHNDTNATSGSLYFGGFFTSTPSNNYVFLYAPSDDYHDCLIRSGGATVASMTSLIDTGTDTVNVVACSWATNDFELYVDGVSVATDTLGAAPAAQPTTIVVGVDSGTGQQLGGWVTDFKIFDVQDEAM